jgi:YHS domain-containing protein
MRQWKSFGRIITLSSIFLLFAIGSQGIAADPPPADPAIKGYDPVAYLTEGRAVKGDSVFAFQWHGMTWNFASRENMELFAASPGAYAPQYDGYCAWAMTESRKAISDPEVWKIVNGKLYLNCSRASFDKWSHDIPGNIEKADRNWLNLTGGEKGGNP